MTFRFRFESILQLRRRERDEAGVEVGRADEAIARIEAQIDEVRRQREGLRQESEQRRTGNVSVDGLLATGRYDLQLQASLKSLDGTLGQLMQERQRRQANLVAAEAEVKRLEKLEQQARQVHAEEQQRREQFDADEQSLIRYTMANQRR